MSRRFILEDKIINTGQSPVYDDGYNVLGYIHYQFFSLRNRIEVKDIKGNLISEGSAKLMTWMPKWVITERNGMTIGTIVRKFSFLSKRYQYQNKYNKIYWIEGNIWDRRFNVTDSQGKEVIKVSTLSSIISLRPHTFLVEIIDETFDKWECISLIQGVRSLIKAERSRANNN